MKQLLNKLIVNSTHLIPKYIIGKVASKYIAGPSLNDGILLAKKLNKKGYCCTLDLLGEEIKNSNQIPKITDSYCNIINEIIKSDIDCNVSLKLTALGLKINEELCWNNLKIILDKAKEKNIFIRMDMEDSSVTQSTINMFLKSKSYYNNCGTVYQACLLRTFKDIDKLDKLEYDNKKINIRLVKGAYKENPNISYSNYDKIKNNYLYCSKYILDLGLYGSFATHDIDIIKEITKYVNNNQYNKELLEFQSLIGVPIENELKSLLEKKFKVRYYIPFGPDWYEFTIRRIQENPDIVYSVLKNLFKF